MNKDKKKEYAHHTANGFCCACEADIAFMSNAEQKLGETIKFIMKELYNEGNCEVINKFLSSIKENK